MMTKRSIAEAILKENPNATFSMYKTTLEEHGIGYGYFASIKAEFKARGNKPFEPKTEVGDRIHWGSDEVEKLATIVFQMRLKDPVSSFIEMVNKAAQQLPTHRRRIIRTAKEIRPIVDAVLAKINKMKENAEKEPTERIIIQEAVPASKIPTVEEVLDGTSNEQILAILLTRTSGVFKGIQERLSRLESSLTQISTQQSRANFQHQIPVPKPAQPKAPHKEPNNKIKIAVVGLLPGQQSYIKNQIGQKVDLRFISKDQTKPSFPQADYVILMTKFISHYWQEAAHSTFEREKVVLHHGGLGGLVDIIKGLED